MMEQEIVDYIIQAQKHGLSEIEIKQNLLNVGWESATVEASFVYAKATDTKANYNQTQTSTQTQSFQKPKPNNNITTHNAVIANILQPSETSNINPLNNNNSSNRFFNKSALLILFVLIFAIGSIILYKYITNPLRILRAYTSSVPNLIYKTDSNIVYKDTVSKLPNSTTSEITLSYKGSSKADYTNNQDPTLYINSEIGYNIYGSNKFSFELILLKQIIYLNIENIEILKGILGKENAKWIKINLEELNKFSNQIASNPENTEYSSKIKEIWNNPNIISNLKHVGIEKVNNTYSHHLQASINSQEVSLAMLKSINLVQNLQKDTSISLTSEQEQVIKGFFSKFTSKELDLWIGIKDNQLYKFHTILSFPTIDQLSNSTFLNLSNSIGVARSKSRDAQRLNDIRSIATALELYYSENGGYPSANSIGEPIGLNPNFMSLFPIAPQPADGSCTNYYNSYWYSPAGKLIKINGKELYNDYSLTFCMGNPTGGYAAGIGKLSPKGIESNIPCPTTQENCINSNPTTAQNILDEVNNMNFDSTLMIDLNFYDFGKEFNLESPEDSLDVFNSATNKESP